ncbi:hypothetical protein AMECASPLE_020115, partial [Ameca splendens]
YLAETDVAAMYNTCIQRRPETHLIDVLLQTFSSFIVETFSDSPPRLKSNINHCHSPPTETLHSSRHTFLSQDWLYFWFIHKCLPHD